MRLLFYIICLLSVEIQCFYERLISPVMAPWPKGIVPYMYSSQLKEREIRIFEEATDLLKKEAKLRFIQNYNESDPHIYLVLSELECVSTIGFNPFQAVHFVSIQKDMTLFGMVHELLHALGFSHEDQRPDSYLHIAKIKKEIKKDYQFLLKISKFFRQTNFIPLCLLKNCEENFPYDLCSIMHLDQYKHSVTGNKIFILLNQDPRRKCQIGQRKMLSPLDKQKMLYYYSEELDSEEYEYLHKTFLQETKSFKRIMNSRFL